MRKSFPAKVLADLGLDAKAPRATPPPVPRGRRKRAVKASAKAQAPTSPAEDLLVRVTMALQPEPDDLDAAWG